MASAFNAGPRRYPLFKHVVSSGTVGQLVPLLGASKGAIFKNGCSVDDHCVTPAMVSGMDRDSTVVRRRVFKPVLPSVAFSGVSAIIGCVGQRRGPLTTCCFKDRRGNAQFVDHASSNNTYVGSAVVRVDGTGLPFKNINGDKVNGCRRRRDFLTFSGHHSLLISPG